MLETEDSTTEHHAILEVLLVAAILGVTFLIWYFSYESQVILNFYYLPVVLTAFYRGRYRARLMAFLSILSASTLFLPSLAIGVLVAELISFGLWAATLMLISILVGSLCEDRVEVMNKLREAHRKDALTDTLTGLANRRAFEFELSRRLADWNRNQTPFCLIVLDIDDFKLVNDRYGHQAGDEVLEAFAKVLKQTMRDQDLVARYGGDEFSIVLAGMDLDSAKDVVERTCKIIETSRFPYRGLSRRFSTSMGIAQILPGEEILSLMQRADAAMYCSKEAGKHCIHYHDGKICVRCGQDDPTRSKQRVTDSTLHAKQNDFYTDQTTGAPTQKVFLEELRRRTSESSRYNSKVSVAIITIDSLRVGIQHDHRTRKNLLATVARLSNQTFRDTDLITRYNATSLAILFPVTALQNSLGPLVRLRNDAAEFHNQQYPSLSYAVSIGITQCLPDDHSEAVVERAESALQEAILTGGNTICFNDGTSCQVVDSIESIELLSKSS